MAIVHRDLSYRIVGCAMHVHREIGPGLEESFYHQALYERLLASGIGCQYKPMRQLIHKGVIADTFEADLIVDNAVVLELKSLEGELAPVHFTQLICYLKCWQTKLGVLFDFGKESLVQKRFVFTERPIHVNALSPPSLRPSTAGDRRLLSRILEWLRGIAGQYGLGYRVTTYRGIFRAEVSSESVAVELRHADIWCDGRNLGPTVAESFVVGGRCAVKILALYERLHALHRATLQTELKHLGLRWGVLANFGKKSLDWQFVIRA